MSAAPLKGRFLRSLDRVLDAGEHLPTRDPRVSPLLSPVPSGLAPALIVTGGHDMLKDEGEAYGRHLQRAGVPVQRLHCARLGHAFINLASVHGEARAAVQHVARDWRALAITPPRSQP